MAKNLSKDKTKIYIFLHLLIIKINEVMTTPIYNNHLLI